MFKLTRMKYLTALQSAEELQKTLETEMENLENSSNILSSNWFGQQSEHNLKVINTSLQEGNHAKALAYTKGMTQVMGEYLPQIDRMMAKREQIGRQLYQDSYYTPDLSQFHEPELIIDYSYIDDVKADADGAVMYGEKAAEILEEMINIVQSAGAGYVDLSNVRELLAEGKRELKRLENYRDEFADFGNKMSDLEYNLSYDLAKIMREQGYTSNEHNPTEMTELDLKERTSQMDEAMNELLSKIESGEYSTDELERFLEIYVNDESGRDVTKAAEEIFKGYEGNTLDEKIYEALRLKGLETDTDYAKIYGYLSADIQGSPYEGKYTQEQLYQIALHFVLTDTPQGKEMPQWWMESNLDCPSELQVTEENVYDMCWNMEYREYYTNGYLVLDMISGMGNAKDGDMPCDSNWVLEHLDKGATDEIFGIWYDYNYGAMAEYVSGRGTVRSVKYALAEKYGFRKDYDTTGNYSVYTNEITDLSTLQENAYLTKYGHYDSYYEEIFGAKRDRYEQLYKYFEDDAKILALTKEEQQFLADFTCLDMGEAGKVATYRDIHTLAEMLKYNMKDFGSGREVIVEGNTIIIRIEGTTDIYTGKEIETHEYTLEFNSEELFGSYYISAGEYANVMGQYSALRIKEGYLGSVQMEELEKQAIRMMESCYTKESLETLSREEYNELLQSCMISADLSGLVYAGYETEHVRAVENFNELKDTFVNTFGMVVLAASMMLPPTAPLTIALFGADATLALGDGILRISQGDELEGTIEAFAGALALGEFAYIVKATRGASQVTYSSLADLMSPEDAESYLKFLKNGSTEGLTKAEIEAIEKVDELLALKKVDYQDILDMRKVNNITEVAEEGVESILKSSKPSGKVWDYSKQFDGELVNFNAGYEIKNVIDEDMYLVQFHSNAEVGSGRSLKYWTTFDEANGISTVDDYMNRMALLSNWGARDNISIAKIPAGTKIKYAIGTAKEQVGAIESRPGGGLQILFEQFDDGWILDTRPLP